MGDGYPLPHHPPRGGGLRGLGGVSGFGFGAEADFDKLANCIRPARNLRLSPTPFLDASNP